MDRRIRLHLAAGKARVFLEKVRQAQPAAFLISEGQKDKVTHAIDEEIAPRVHEGTVAAQGCVRTAGRPAPQVGISDLERDVAGCGPWL